MSRGPTDATIAAMDTSARTSSSSSSRLRHCLQRAIARGSRRGHVARGEGGAVLVEFAIVFPLLVLITFGIIEYSAAYHDSAIAADAVRAGGRVGSAIATDPSYTTTITNAVDAALATLPADAPKELWIYKANTAGYQGSSNNFSSC
jgi:Flp pilus assembly protein TadG